MRYDCIIIDTGILMNIVIRKSSKRMNLEQILEYVLIKIIERIQKRQAEIYFSFKELSSKLKMDKEKLEGIVSKIVRYALPKGKKISNLKDIRTKKFKNKIIINIYKELENENFDRVDMLIILYSLDNVLEKGKSVKILTTDLKLAQTIENKSEKYSLKKISVNYKNPKDVSLKSILNLCL